MGGFCILVELQGWRVCDQQGYFNFLFVNIYIYIEYKTFKIYIFLCSNFGYFFWMIEGILLATQNPVREIFFKNILNKNFRDNNKW